MLGCGNGRSVNSTKLLRVLPFGPVGEWTASFDAQCVARVEQIVARPVEPHCTEPWQTLLAGIAPSVEVWAARSWLLKRWRLRSEDDARAVLVSVIAQLHADEFRNLRKFVDKRELHSDDDDDITERMARFAGLLDEDEPPEVDDSARKPSTPFRGWLINLVRFAAREHVRVRLGWRAAMGAGPSKRALGTDATRLSDVAEAGQRPPLTDYVTVKALVDEISAFTEEFPKAMRQALTLWLADLDFDEIAAELALDQRAEARKLVRAAQARLRKQFRGRWEQLHGAVDG